LSAPFDTLSLVWEVTEPEERRAIPKWRARAAAASDKEGVAAGMKMIGAGCKGCYDAHREKVSDTVYKIK